MASPYEIAREQGYTDEEISAYLAQKNPKVREALNQGYSIEEVSNYLSQKSSPKESIGVSVGRQAGRLGARATETVLGAPRAFGEFLEGLVPEKALKKGASKIGLEKPIEKALQFQKKYAPYKLLPKSEDIRENVTKHLFGEKLEPKNKWEKAADEFVSDFAALALPLPGSQIRLLKPFLVSAGANAVAEGVGYMGGTDKQKSYAKIGSLLAGSMINPRAAENLKNGLYSQARSVRPPDAKVDAWDLNNNVKKLRSELLKGGSAPYKTAALKKLDELEEVAKSGDIRVDELENFKISINSLLGGLYEEFKGNKPGRKLAKGALERVAKIVDDGLDVYSFSNPEWAAFYRPANEVHGAIAQSHKARNVITRTAKKYGLHAILPALGIGHAIGMPAAVGMAATAAGGSAALIGGEIAAKFAKSPTLQKHYLSLINSALKEDVVAVHENLEKLKKELDKEKATQILRPKHP